MRKLVMAINITADGFCDHDATIADEELLDFFSDLVANADTMLYGRKTFELMYPYWPDIVRNNAGSNSEIAFAQLLNAIEKIVFSKQPLSPSWEHTRVLHDLSYDVILNLKEEEEKGTILVSGIDIGDQLAKMKLIDEYCFVVHPVLGGRGKHFFQLVQLDRRAKLALLETYRLQSGAMALFYKVTDWDYKE